MSSLPRADAVVDAYEDQVEALEALHHQRAKLSNSTASRFHGLTPEEIAQRLERDRAELDQWALLMVLASFEATVREDVRLRHGRKTKDAVRPSLQMLEQANPGRVRFDDILSAWDAASSVGQDLKGRVRNLMKHRHWLAHGRYWTNKHGQVPSPLDALGYLDDYCIKLRMRVPTFPLGGT